MNLAIIPARGGSKRIRHKNVVDFCGRPIIAYSLDCARDSGLFDKIHVSTDSPEIAAAVEKLGYEIDFFRTPDLADDMTPLMPVVRWVTEQYVERGAAVESICLMLPCAPLIQPQDLRGAYEVFKQKGPDVPLVSSVPYAFPIQRALYHGEDQMLHPLFPEHWSKRSQDLPLTFHDAGAFYFFGRDQVLNGGQTIGNDMIPYVMPRYRAVDIDEPEDLKMAEIIYRGLQALGP
ncbi:MAG: pseudaminic acid cytidylyltransferase [Kiloniellaceae bacterium]